MNDIEKAIHATINPIIDAHLLIGDIEASDNFAVYAVRRNPRRTKEGVIGYQGEILISVLNRVEDTVRTKSNEIITALEDLEGTTKEEIRFTIMQHQSYSTDYSQDDDMYFSEIVFNYTTKI
ncbi:MAG: hypothetical protein ACLFQA_00385 [Bacteroidales bacterium]